MKIARVVGQVVGTQMHPQFVSKPLLVVQPETIADLSGGGRLIAVDRIGVDVGERVLVVDDGAAARGLLGVAGPIRSLIVGVVDECHTEAE